MTDTCVFPKLKIGSQLVVVAVADRGPDFQTYVLWLPTSINRQNPCPQSSKFFPFRDFLRNPSRSTEGSNSQHKYQNKLIVGPDSVGAAVIIG